MEVQILSSAPIYLTKFDVNPILLRLIAGWSSLVARRAHNPKVVGSNPAPATIFWALYGLLLYVVMTSTIEKLETNITKDIESFGLSLWGIELSGNSRSKLIRIFIDKKNGVDIDDCQKVSNQVNELLTNIELVSFDYTLEVSSPGLDRKFFKLEQFHEFIGHEIKVKFYDGNKKITKIALLLSANEEGIFLKDENEFFINFDKVIVARLEPIFEVSNE